MYLHTKYPKENLRITAIQGNSTSWNWSHTQLGGIWKGQVEWLWNKMSYAAHWKIWEEKKIWASKLRKNVGNVLRNEEKGWELLQWSSVDVMETGYHNEAFKPLLFSFCLMGSRSDFWVMQVCKVYVIIYSLQKTYILPLEKT